MTCGSAANKPWTIELDWNGPLWGRFLVMKPNKSPVRAILCWMLLLLADANAAAQDVAEQNEHAGIAEFVPPNDGYDWLRLVSGEWLRGELVGAFGDEVEFDSDILDELEIDAEDIDQFYSPRVFGVSIRGRDVIIGRVHVKAETVTVRVGKDALEFSRDELVAIAASAERERDRWSGDIGLGINVRQGNTEFIEYNMIAGVERRTAQSRIFVDYIGNFNETAGVEVTNNHRVNGVLDRFSGSRLFWRPVVFQYFRDPFQNIEHQGTMETGLGYEMTNTSRTEWDFFAAVGVNYVERASVESGQPTSSTSPALSIGTNFETELTSWMDYLFSFTATFVDEESGTYQHHMLTTLSSDLVGNIDVDISFVWDRTENPPPLADGTLPERDDYRLLVGLSYEF